MRRTQPAEAIQRKMSSSNSFYPEQLHHQRNFRWNEKSGPTAGGNTLPMRNALKVQSKRGLTKSCGERLGTCGAGQVREEFAKSLSEPLQNALKPLLAEGICCK
jgi:hypothetical protein